MTNIAERLRSFDTTDDAMCPYSECGPLMREAADEIERLEAKCVQTDRYIALLNDEISDNGKLRDEIERLRAERSET